MLHSTEVYSEDNVGGVWLNQSVGIKEIFEQEKSTGSIWLAAQK